MTVPHGQAVSFIVPGTPVPEALRTFFPVLEIYLRTFLVSAEEEAATEEGLGALTSDMTSTLTLWKLPLVRKRPYQSQSFPPVLIVMVRVVEKEVGLRPVPIAREQVSLFKVRDFSG